MDFKKWLTEWEGFNFSQEKNLVNGPQYPNSKYKGKGDPEEANIDPLPQGKKVKRAFGFGDEDELLKLQEKKPMKKMRSQD